MPTSAVSGLSSCISTPLESCRLSDGSGIMAATQGASTLDLHGSCADLPRGAQLREFGAQSRLSVCSPCSSKWATRLLMLRPSEWALASSNFITEYGMDTLSRWVGSPWFCRSAKDTPRICTASKRSKRPRCKCRQRPRCSSIRCSLDS